jgi:PST family polysaccharide transporter
MAQRPRAIRQITRRIVATKIWSTALSLSLLACYAMLSPQPGAVRSLLLLFGVSLLPMPYLFQWVFLGRQWMRYVSIAQVVRYGTFAGIVLLTVQGAADVWCVAAAEFAGVLAAALFTVVCLRWKQGFWPPALAGIPERSVVRQAVPLALSHLMWAAKYVLVTVLVGFLAGLEENAARVGHFGAAVRIIVALSAFISLYFNNLLPSVSQAVSDSAEWLASLLDRAIRAAAWVSLCGALLLIIGAPHVVRLIYGEAYGQAVVLLRILVWMLVAALVSTHFRVTLIAASRQGLELLSTAGGAALTLALVVVLYHRFGLPGVAVAMVLGELGTLILSSIFVHRGILPVRPGQCLRAPMAAAVAAVLLLLAGPGAPAWAKAAAVVLIFLAAAAVLDPQLLGGLRRVGIRSPRAQ